MRGDRELAFVRQKYYGMFVKMFWKEPDSEFILSLLEGIAERVRGSSQSSPLMSEGWKEIRHYIEKKGAIISDLCCIYYPPKCNSSYHL